jgi:hypothetical protein
MGHLPQLYWRALIIPYTSQKFLSELQIYIFLSVTLISFVAAVARKEFAGPPRGSVLPIDGTNDSRLKRTDPAPPAKLW